MYVTKGSFLIIQYYSTINLSIFMWRNAFGPFIVNEIIFNISNMQKLSFLQISFYLIDFTAFKFMEEIHSRY